jgi:multiple sugar transport system permease protein
MGKTIMKKPGIDISALAPLLLLFFSIVFLLPFLYALYTSFVSQEYANKIAPLSGFVLDNYRAVFGLRVGRWLFNSLLVTLSILAGNMAVNTMAAYALAKIRFPGRKIIFFIIIAMMMIPYQTVIIPLYVMMVNLGWLNTLLCLIVPFLFQGFYVFLMRQFFLTMPDELIEAATIDGLSIAGTFFKIILPNSRTALAMQAIFSFTGTWNFLTWAATFINDDRYYILPLGLNTLKNRYYAIPGYTMAGVVVMTIPVMLVFLLLQKYFVQGIVTSGIKL